MRFATPPSSPRTQGTQFVVNHVLCLTSLVSKPHLNLHIPFAPAGGRRGSLGQLPLPNLAPSPTDSTAARRLHVYLADDLSFDSI